MNEVGASTQPMFGTRSRPLTLQAATSFLNLHVWTRLLHVPVMSGQEQAAETTVTLKLHVLVLPEASTSVALTGVVPSGNVEPLAGTMVSVVPGQLSSASPKVEFTMEFVTPTSTLEAMLPGQISDGGSLSLTGTVKEHCAVPAEVGAVTVTV